MLENMGQSGAPRVIVCCGSGGVGKTTVSAAIGLHGALSGLKTIVLTIDPARRLADFMGIGAFPDKPVKVPLDVPEAGSGELHAMMLDAKRTFDHLISRYAPGDMQPRIFSNRYYQHLSENMGGSHEYMAMEKLYEIYQQGEWDLIVLDTPPSRRALDFLDAPERVLNLLGNQYFRRILNPGSRAGKLGGMMFGLVKTPMLKAVSQMVGKRAMEDLFGFFSLFNDALFDGFQQRAKAVESLLSDPVTAFIAVTTPMAYPMREAEYFYERLNARGMPFHGFIVNRVHRSGDPAAVNALFSELEASDLIPSGIVRQLEMSYRQFQSLAESDKNKIRQLRQDIDPGIPVLEIPMDNGEVCDIDGLLRLRQYLTTL